MEHDGARRAHAARVFDFDCADNNDWLLASELTVKGEKTCRADLVAFVNGIPLAVIALKDPEDEHTDLSVAFHRLQELKANIQALFETNLCCVMSDGAVARVGSITAEQERFMPWRDAHGTEETGERLELEVLVRGLLSRETLLEYLRYFVAFHRSGTGSVKRLAGYHQYHAVRNAARQATEAVTERQDGRGGIVWFTPGSGKSLLALFYTGLLRERPEFDNPTVVIVSQPNVVDDHMFDTFAECTIPAGIEPRKAETFTELKDLLREHPHGGVLFATVQKFPPHAPGEPSDVLGERPYVIVICDDLHDSKHAFKAAGDTKSEHETGGLARHVRAALPNGVHLGLTSSPVPEVDQEWRAVFGEYAAMYDMASSRRDGATVPIHYERRRIDLAADTDTREACNEDPGKGLESGAEDDRGEAVARPTPEEAVARADARLGQLTRDLITHWDNRLEAIDGKAMIVARSRRAAVALYDEIVKVRPQWHDDALDKGVIKVVVSNTRSDPAEVRGHETTSEQREQLKARLKDPADPLKLVIVRDRWVTDLDASCLHTLYVDKPMQGTPLMQAMARVNRVWKDKPGGLVVDYVGLGDEVQAAIAHYTRIAGPSRGRPVELIEEAVRALNEALDGIREMFHGLDLAGISEPHLALDLLPQAMDRIVKVDPGGSPQRNEGVRRFIDLTATASKAQAIGGTHDAALERRDECGFHQAVRSALIKYTYSGKTKPGRGRDTAMREIVARNVLVEGAENLYATLGVDEPDSTGLDERFVAEVARLPTRHLAAELLQRVIDDEIERRSRTNTTQGHKYGRKLTEAIGRGRRQGGTAGAQIEELSQLAEEIRQDRPPEHMSEAEFAFYEALRESGSSTPGLGERSLQSLAAELRHKLRASAIFDWEKREGTRASMHLLVNVLLSRYSYPPESQPEAVTRIIEQAELYADQWAIEHP